MFLKEFREFIGLSQKDFADKLGLTQASIARYETDKMNPTTTVIQKYIDIFNANPNFLFLGLEPLVLSSEDEYLSKNNQEIIKDLSLLLPQNELNSELNKILIDKVLNRFSKDDEKSTIMKILSALHLEGHIPYRPFLFLYYTFKYVSENSDELQNIKSYKEYFVELVKRYNQFSIKNDPMFSEKIKSEIEANIELNFTEEETKILLTHPMETIKKLEEKMTSGMVRTHRNKNMKDLFPKK